MQRDYDVRIADDPQSQSFLEQGCIKCVVSQTAHPFRTRRFFYCIHCSRLGCSSWFFDHRKKVEIDLSPKSIDKFRSCFIHVVGDIHSEIDYLFERGTLFEERRGSGRRIQRKTTRLRRWQDKDTSSALVPRPPIADADEIGQVDEEAENGDDRTDSLDEDVETISLGFYESCFSKANFNPQSFISHCHSLFQEYENKTNQKTTILKAKVISNVMRKVFSELSMTRRQMDKLNRFIKAVILCVAPEHGVWQSIFMPGICHASETALEEWPKRRRVLISLLFRVNILPLHLTPLFLGRSTYCPAL